MGIIFLPDAHSLIVIELEPGQLSPPGAEWVNIGPCLGGSWYMDGTLPNPSEIVGPFGEYRSTMDARDAAIAHAHKTKVDVLWIEIDARRC